MKTVEEGNKLIAEFVGLYTSNVINPQPKPLDYHKSWDLLAPVVKSIKGESIERDIDLFDGHQEVQVYGIEDAIWEDNVGGAFIHVCDLIIFLNEEKKSNEKV